MTPELNKENAQLTDREKIESPIGLKSNRDSDFERAVSEPPEPKS